MSRTPRTATIRCFRDRNVKDPIDQQLAVFVKYRPEAIGTIYIYIYLSLYHIISCHTYILYSMSVCHSNEYNAYCPPSFVPPGMFLNK